MAGPGTNTNRGAHPTFKSHPQSGAGDPLRIAVLGSGRSGNTWMRLLLSELYCLDHSGVSDPEEFDWAGAPERCVIHAHPNPDDELRELLHENGWRVVTMARHPLDVLISHLRWGQLHRHRWAAAIAGATPASSSFVDFGGSEWSDEMLAKSRLWWTLGDTTGVRYERLVGDPRAELEGLVARIGVDPLSSAEIAVERTAFKQLRARDRNDHYWQGRPGLWRTLLPERQAVALGHAHQENLDFWNYVVDPDPSLTDEQADATWRELNLPVERVAAPRRHKGRKKGLRLLHRTLQRIRRGVGSVVDRSWLGRWIPGR